MLKTLHKRETLKSYATFFLEDLSTMVSNEQAMYAAINHESLKLTHFSQKKSYPNRNYPFHNICVLFPTHHR
jgi:hypothetical protein